MIGTCMAGETTIRIGTLLRKTLESAGIADKVDRQMAVAFWEDIVGSKLASKTTALKVEKDVLKVKVISSSWRNELVFLKKAILKKVARRIGKGKINDIYFY